jgi:hypothetical protein
MPRQRGINNGGEGDHTTEEQADQRGVAIDLRDHATLAPGGSVLSVSSPLIVA